MIGLDVGDAQRDLEAWLHALEMVAQGWELPQLPPELQRVPPG